MQAGSGKNPVEQALEGIIPSSACVLFLVCIPQRHPLTPYWAILVKLAPITIETRSTGVSHGRVGGRSILPPSASV